MAYINNHLQESINKSKYKYYVFGHYPSSCFYLKTVLFIYFLNKRDCVRFEVSTAMTLKNAVLLDVVPCSYCVNRRLGGTSVNTISTRDVCTNVPQSQTFRSY
jgi:hypothetical protein